MRFSILISKKLFHSFLTTISYISSAAGLYYIAELVEEYTVIAKKTISWLVLVVTSVYVLFIFFDDLPWSIVLCGLAAQATHGLIMANFPYVKFASIPFIGSVTLLLVNHYLAFDYFTQNYFNFSEVSNPNQFRNSFRHQFINFILSRERS